MAKKENQGNRIDKNSESPRKMAPAQRSRRRQPRKDSSSKRVNFDNTRESRFARDIKRDACKADANDPSWYAQNAELMRAAASYNFATTVDRKCPGQQPYRFLAFVRLSGFRFLEQELQLSKL